MDKLAKEIFRKNFWFMGVAATLQMLSGIFFFVGAVKTMKDVKSTLKEALIAHLTEE